MDVVLIEVPVISPELVTVIEPPLVVMIEPERTKLVPVKLIPEAELVLTLPLNVVVPVPASWAMAAAVIELAWISRAVVAVTAASRVVLPMFPA